MIAVFSVFVGYFGDGPIEPCGPTIAYAIKQHPDGYCGKQGQPHTLADYQAYEKWSRIFWIGWPIGLGALAFLAYATRKTG